MIYAVLVLLSSACGHGRMQQGTHIKSEEEREDRTDNNFPGTGLSRTEKVRGKCSEYVRYFCRCIRSVRSNENTTSIGEARQVDLMSSIDGNSHDTISAFHTLENLEEEPSSGDGHMQQGIYVKSGQEERTDYRCFIRPIKDTIYVSEGGRSDLVLTIDGDVNDLVGMSYTVENLEEEFNKSGNFSLLPHDTVYYGDNSLTYTTEEVGAHHLRFTIKASRNDATILRTLGCVINVQAQQYIPYQVTGELYKRAYNTVILTISDVGNQCPLTSSSNFHIENVDWTNGVSGYLTHLPLKLGVNKINFYIQDYSSLRFDRDHKLVLTLGGDARESKEVIIDIANFIAIKRIRDQAQQVDEGGRILRELDEVLGISTNTMRCYYEEKPQLTSLLPQARFLLFLLEEDMKITENKLAQSKEYLARAGLSTALGGNDLELRQEASQKMWSDVRKKIEEVESSVLVLGEAGDTTNALRSSDESASALLVNDTAQDLGIVLNQEDSLFRSIIDQGNTSGIEILQREAAGLSIAYKFGATQWHQYFGDVGTEPPIPVHISTLLNQPCKLFPGKKVHETHLLTLIPALVDGQPLTLNKFKELLEQPRETGFRGKYNFYCADVRTGFGDEACEASHWVLMTRHVVRGSEYKDYDYQIRFIEYTARSLSIPYTLVSVLEGVVSTMCHRMATGENVLFKTSSRCRDILPRRLPNGGYFTVIFESRIKSGIDLKNGREEIFVVHGVVAAVR